MMKLNVIMSFRRAGTLQELPEKANGDFKHVDPTRGMY